MHKITAIEISRTTKARSRIQRAKAVFRSSCWLPQDRMRTCILAILPLHRPSAEDDTGPTNHSGTQGY